MSAARPVPPSPESSPAWQTLLRRFKEKIAERLWGLPTVTESEKEMVFGALLSDLDGLERNIAEVLTDSVAQRRSRDEENDLLRSLLGVSEDELRTRVMTLAQDVAARERENEQLQNEVTALRNKTTEAEQTAGEFRERMRRAQSTTESERLQYLRQREDDVRHFSESNESLKVQLKDLESRLANLRVLFSDANQKLITEKQDEITGLQKKLLDEMETALRHKQKLMWAEEEMFANGIARRVRTALVSTQGQLLLTLERLGLLEPETRNEAFWKARLRLFVEGAPELSRNFKSMQNQLQDLTALLDDYMQLTRRRPLGRQSVSLKDLVQQQLAELYVDRRPTLVVEVLSDDPLPEVIGDAAMLRFVVAELLRNALEALPNDTGRIVLSLKNHPDRREIELLVRDTGPGIPNLHQARLFEPFFSTKEHHQGLSLSRARRYADFHGGHLVLQHSGPEGSVFQLVVPWEATPPAQDNALGNVPSIAAMELKP